MSTYTNTIVLELLVRSNELKKGLQQAGADAKAARQELETFRESASRALSFAGTIGIGAGVFLGIKKATQAYGEFINQAATAKQVFGSSFGELEESMQGAVKTFGLSNTEFLRSTTLLAGLGKSAGIAEQDLAKFSTSLTMVASDLAAAFNTDVADAVAAIQSGFSGSSIEPLRRYNIVLNDTILKNEYFALSGEKVTGVLTQQQRMAAFLSKLTKESADYTGQWARENDEFNGTMQRLKATVANASEEIGGSFEPAITSVSNLIIPVVSGVTDLNSALGGLPIQLALFGGALYAARTPLAMLDEAMLVFMNRQKPFGPTLSKSQNAVRVLSNTFASIGTSTFVGAAAMTVFAVQTSVARKRAEELKKAIGDLGKGSAEEQIKNLVTVLEDLSRSADKDYDFSEVWKGTITATKDVEAEFEKLLETSPEVAQAILAIAKRGGEGAATIQKYGLTVAEMEAALAKANTEAEQQADLQAEIDTILAENGAQVERNAEAWDDYADALDGIADRAKEAEDALNDAADAAQDIFEQTGDVDLERLKVFQSLGTWIEEAFAPLDDGETQLDRTITNAENYQDVLGQIGEAADAAAFGLEGMAAVDAKITFLEDLRDDVAAISPEVAALIDGLIASLGDTKLSFDVSTEEGQANLDAFLAANTDASVIADMLIDTGVAEETVDTFIGVIGEEKAASIAVKAITKLAEEDIEALNDPDRVAEVVTKALTDEAQTQIDDLTSYPYVAEAKVVPDLIRFNREVNAARTAAGKEIVVPIRTTTGTRPTTPTTTPQPDGLLLMDEFGRQLTTDDGQAYGVPTRYRQTVTAGQPIINNNTYVTVPTADPSATVRAIQRWSRWNGNIPVSRGR
jgi:hypothetical protein